MFIPHSLTRGPFPYPAARGQRISPCHSHKQSRSSRGYRRSRYHRSSYRRSRYRRSRYRRSRYRRSRYRRSRYRRSRYRRSRYRRSRYPSRYRSRYRRYSRKQSRKLNTLRSLTKDLAFGGFLQCFGYTDLQSYTV